MNGPFVPDGTELNRGLKPVPLAAESVYVTPDPPGRDPARPFAVRRRVRAWALVASAGLFPLAGCAVAATPPPDSVAARMPAPADSPSAGLDTAPSRPPTPRTTGGTTGSPVPARPTPVDLGPAPTCAPARLRLSLVYSNAGAGHEQDVFALTNTGPRCQLHGYPTVALLDAAGRAVPVRASRSGHVTFRSVKPRLVVLAPGRSASFDLGYRRPSPGDETSCREAAVVLVTPPGRQDALRLAHPVSPCGGQLAVSPVVTGSQGVRG